MAERTVSGRRAEVRGALLLILGVVLLATTAWYLRSLLRAASVLYSFSEKPPPWAVRMYDRYSMYQGRFEDLTVPGAGGEMLSLRVYIPTGLRQAPTIVVIHGATPEGNRTVTLNRLATALARQGFRVVLPTLPQEAEMNIARGDLQVIGDTIQWASATAGGDKVSVFGISFGGGLTIAAADRPEVKKHLRLIFTISGYNDMNSVAKYYTHVAEAAPDGTPYPANGPLGGAILFIKPYLNEMVPAEDVGPTRVAIQRLFAAGRFPVKMGDPVLEGLTRAQQERFVHLELIDTPEVRAAYRALIARHHDDFLAVSPRPVLPRLDVPLYVLHATMDRSIPEGEVEWMKTEVGRGSESHFLVSPWMQHAKVRNSVPWRERLRVGSFIALVLERAAGY